MYQSNSFSNYRIDKEKLNYKNSFFKEVEKEKERYALDERDYESGWSCS